MSSPKPAAKAAARKPVSKKTASKKPVAKKTAAKTTAAKKTATKKPAPKKLPRKAPARTAAPRPAAQAARKPTADPALSADAKRLAAAIERSVADGRPDALAPDALQALMGALCRTYSTRLEMGDQVLPLASRNAVSPTDVMQTASGLLRGADLQVFELGMWQSWTGR